MVLTSRDHVFNNVRLFFYSGWRCCLHFERILRNDHIVFRSFRSLSNMLIFVSKYFQSIFIVLSSVFKFWDFSRVFCNFNNRCFRICCVNCEENNYELENMINFVRLNIRIWLIYVLKFSIKYDEFFEIYRNFLLRKNYK